MDQTIEHINDGIEIAKRWADYWIAMATTGAAKDREMYHGTGTDDPFTDEEKVADALKTAKTHIVHLTDLVDKKIFMLSERREDETIQ